MPPKTPPTEPHKTASLPVQRIRKASVEQAAEVFLATKEAADEHAKAKKLLQKETRGIPCARAGNVRILGHWDARSKVDWKRVPKRLKDVYERIKEKFTVRDEQAAWTMKKVERIE